MATDALLNSPARQRVLVLGATGTIGQAAVKSLLREGHEVVCFIRAKAGVNGKLSLQDWEAKLPGAIFRTGDVTDSKSLFQDGFAGERFETVLSCLASRTGNPKDAWAIDHAAHMLALNIAQNSGVKHFVLLSAICVQKPLLAFQHAKLAFEDALISSGMSYAIVRPTAFFKSLCGQIDRVRKGKPFLVFGDGQLTACKPISDQDLGNYLAQCVIDPALHNRILPIGGPGPAITPLQQGEYLFSLLGQTPKYSHVPVKMMDLIIGALSLLGYLIPALAQKAELARIGRYYATESMLVWDATLGRYDANATPSTGQETLWDCYQSLVSGQTSLERGDHAVF
ncbi:MAG: NAD(P)H-binding protein [Burkholderiales bacterium]|nr:NAD(P)H-binding protein [Burkholderiales bacterium]